MSIRSGGIEAEGQGGGRSAVLLLPATLLGYALNGRIRHQVVLSVLSILVFLLGTVPLELQRRIVDEAIHERDIWTIAYLAMGYAVLALSEGLVKLAMNIYRGWISEDAIRDMRVKIHAAMDEVPFDRRSKQDGIEASIILSEVEPVGGFIGVLVSEPLLQGGLLLSVFGYMLHLQSEIALVCLIVFVPQMFFLPKMQKAINARIESRVGMLRDVSQGIVDMHNRNLGSDVQQAKRIDDVFALNMGIYRLKFSMNFLMNFMHHLGIAIVLGVGGWYASTGRIDVGMVVAFVSGLVKVNDPWGDFVNWTRDAAVNSLKYKIIVAAVEPLS